MSYIHYTSKLVLDSGHLGQYIHQGLGTLRCASSIPRQDRVTFSCRSLGEMEHKHKTPSGSSLIALH